MLRYFLSGIFPGRKNRIRALCLILLTLVTFISLSPARVFRESEEQRIATNAKTKRVALVGAGNRALYFAPALAYLQDLRLIKVIAVATRSGRVDHTLRDRFSAMEYTSIHKMLEEERPDIVLILIHGNSNSVVLEQVAQSYLGTILIETPVYNCSPSLLVRGNIGVLENWPYLPLEQLKQQIIGSGILGKLVRVANVRRSICTHGAAKARAYANFPTNFSKINKVDTRAKWTHARGWTTSGLVVDNLYPKGGMRTMLVEGEFATLMGNCVLTPANAIDALLLLQKKSGKINRLEVTAHWKSETDLPSQIQTSIANETFLWKNSHPQALNLDSKQYASMLHIFQVASSQQILYPLFQHVTDTKFCV